MRCRCVDCPFRATGTAKPSRSTWRCPRAHRSGRCCRPSWHWPSSRQPSHRGAWRLDRVSGPSLDESITLAENGVHDGELLVLAAVDAPALGLVRWGPFRTVAEAGSPPRRVTARARARLRLGSGPRLAGVVREVGRTPEHPSAHRGDRNLHCRGGGSHRPKRGIDRRHGVVGRRDRFPGRALGSGPRERLPGGRGSRVHCHWCCCGGSISRPSTLVATACFSALIAVVVIVPVVTVVPVATVGAILSVAALGVLAMSGRMAIPLSGITTDQHADDRRTCDPRPCDVGRPDRRMHRRRGARHRPRRGRMPSVTARRAWPVPDSQRRSAPCCSCGSAPTSTRRVEGPWPLQGWQVRQRLS